MKSKLPYLIALIFLINIAKAAVVTVTNSGFTFSPSNITINLGDTVIFALGLNHNAVEVSQSTYNANGSTALSGGFSIAFGGGTLLTGNLSVGTHYYVCTPHAGMGMKGTITVVNNTNGINNVSNINLHFKFYPNPASEKIGINYSTNVNGKVSLKLFDLTGKMVAILFEDESSAGSHYQSVQIDRNRFGSGFYFLEFNCEGRKVTRQVILE
jgi:plastocyanin